MGAYIYTSKVMLIYNGVVRSCLGTVDFGVGICPKIAIISIYKYFRDGPMSDYQGMQIRAWCHIGSDKTIQVVLEKK
jgi:hypothetical protein